jgi:N-acetylneuraminic acid mutarotase
MRLTLSATSIDFPSNPEKKTMRFAPVFVLLVTAVAPAADLEHLPANTWVEIKYKTIQPADPTEKGSFARQGWNKIVYDPDGKRVLFYDRWINKKHGGWTIYGNCLFGFDPAAGQLTPIKIDNWTKIDPRGGGYRTLALPENDKEPTPCPRHVYHAFEYVSELKTVFICNGANQTALDKEGKLVGHDLCDGAWRLDLKTNRWTKLDATRNPPNFLDDAMAYCPDTKTLIYSGNNRQLWILDPAKEEWRKAKQSPPRRPSCGQTIFYDPLQRRMLLLGGGPLDGWKKEKAAGAFRELYAFDPKTEQVKKLADAPTAFYESHLAYDRKNKRFIAVAVFDKGEHPSGIFAYDSQKDAWHEIKSANPIPPHKNWFGWMQLCYDAHNDCLIGKVNDQFFAFRHVPGK